MNLKSYIVDELIAITNFLSSSYWTIIHNAINKNVA